MSILDEFKGLEADRGIDEELSKLDKYTFMAKGVSNYMNSWPNQTSKTDVLSASQLHGVCPREFVLNYWNPVANRSFDWQSMIKMSTGTHLHHVLQNHILGPMGLLWGNWIGDYGTITKEEKSCFHPDPDRTISEIVAQKPITWIYKEPTVYAPHWRISGHMDGFLDCLRVEALHDLGKAFKKEPAAACKRLHSLPPGEKILLEIKTVGSYGYEQLSVANPKSIAEYYRMQACIYEAISGVFKTLFWFMERDNVQSKVIMYEYEKGWWREAKHKAKVIWTAIKERTLPESMMACKLPTDKRAKACAHSKACWKKWKAGEFEKWTHEMEAAQPARTFLDLSKWEAEPKDEVSGATI